MLPLKENNDGVIILVQVLPRASRSEVVGVRDGAIKIKLSSPPIEGKANEECIALIGKAFGIRKSNIEIISGLKGRKKSILLYGAKQKDIERYFQEDGAYKAIRE
ncbi:MAG: DUF167 domain-containing protein [Deltaproteobacteria bacterium]